MSTSNHSKLNHLLTTEPLGVVLTTVRLNALGYSLDLQKRYRRSGWLRSIGTGAQIREGDQVDILGGIYALQSQLGLFIHPGAKTALSMLGKSHYLELSLKSMQLFGGQRDNLPLWFSRYDWGVRINCKLTTFLPADLGLVEVVHKGVSVKVSSPARAVMECLYLAPRWQSLIEVYELMEGLNNLRPKSVQPLLEACSSIKVKRLFLYLAEKAGHAWFDYLNLEKIDLGSGKRVIEKNGIYVPKYQITIPRNLEAV